MFLIGFLHLTVIEEDEAINVPPENVTVEVGKTAIMTCESHGNLKDYTSWVKLESTDDDQDTVESFTVLKEASEHLEIKNAFFPFFDECFLEVISNAFKHIEF